MSKITETDFDEIIEQSCRSFRQAAQDSRAAIVAEINKAILMGEDAFTLTHKLKLDLDKMNQDDELKFNPAPISKKITSAVDLEDPEQPEIPGINGDKRQGAAGNGDSGAPVDDGQPTEAGDKEGDGDE